MKPKATSLQTSSLRILFDQRRGAGFDDGRPKLLRDILISFLLCLPDSCVKIGLEDSGLSKHDLHGYKCVQEPQHHGGHLCLVVQQILPRLHNLQLKVRCVCPSVVGISSKYSGDQKKDWKFQAPHLQSLLINTSPCSVGFPNNTWSGYERP